MTSVVSSAGSGRRRDQTEYAHLAPLFTELVNRDNPAEYRSRLRDRLVAEYLDVAKHIANRFAQRGQATEDLVQVAALGLVNAVDRFDPDRGRDFLAFAVPTITGEVRRYFRDFGWAVRVPRRLQELRSSISKAIVDLGHEFGRAPTASELAEHLGVDVEDVHQGYHAGSAYQASSLEELSTTQDDTRRTFDKLVGAIDERLSNVEDRELLCTALGRLPERERTIIWLRFFDNLTQTQIATRMNLSQMHVSRLLSKSMQTMRDALTQQERRVSDVRSA